MGRVYRILLKCAKPPFPILITSKTCPKTPDPTPVTSKRDIVTLLASNSSSCHFQCAICPATMRRSQGKVMRRRSKGDGGPVKTRRRKTATSKRRLEPKIKRGRRSAVAGREEKVARLTRELDEALERQNATSDVLRIISGSPGDLKAVFDAMLANAVRLCGARFGNLALFDGNDMRMAAMHNAPRAFEDLRRGDPVIPLDRSILGPVVKTKKVKPSRRSSSAIRAFSDAFSALSAPISAISSLDGSLSASRIIRFLNRKPVRPSREIYRQFTSRSPNLGSNEKL